MRLIYSLLIITLATTDSVVSQSNGTTGLHPETRTYSTQRTPVPPTIDGDLSDEVWEMVSWSGGFTQLRPYAGEAPTQETEFKILYDDQALYLAIRCHDTEPHLIEKRMSRRDGFAGDWVEVNIDSYFDRRTAFSFTASVSGVKGDEFVTEDGNNWDTSWDPVWKFRTQIDSLGWTAELEIPLSQLRFSGSEEQIWGFQMTRRDFRNESRSVWQYIDPNAGYWVSGFGQLHGIRGIIPKRQVEIQPYVLGQIMTSKADPENPFTRNTDPGISAGVDGKIGLTNDITLDFTINPDFGQVEADPSVLVLDGFQVFFEERRPFFIENRNLFNFSISNSIAGGIYDRDNLFYSRRIGAQPKRHAAADPSEGIYTDQPEFTSILGAVKVSGKTRNGLSLGIMEAVTNKEYAKIAVNGDTRREAVEPLTSYFAGRVRQDINGGNTIIGGMLTMVHRDIDDPQLAFLHKNAQTAAVDFQHRWNDRTWNLNGRLLLSRVAGSTEAIQRTQTAFEHGFTRPGADHLHFDPEATELIGQGGNVDIGRFGSKFRFQTGLTWRSPKLELNDIGFLRNTDEIIHYYWMAYRENDPFGIFRSAQVNYNHWSRWDFGGANLLRATNVNAHGEFTNFWQAGAGATYENLDISNNWLRGGPAYRKSSGIAAWAYIVTDQRKPVLLSVEGFRFFPFDYDVHVRGISAQLRLQAADALNFSIATSYQYTNRIDQYVATRQWNENTRYILGEIEQKTLHFTARINYNITPDLTIQYYGQPFISRGEFSRFNYVTNPLAIDKDHGLHVYNDAQIAFENNTYHIDESGDGSPDYKVHNPDFNFVQFRSNLVARWEYVPGSEIFLVWSQGNTAAGLPDEQRLFSRLTDDAFGGEKVRNTFLLKVTYRFLNR